MLSSVLWNLRALARRLWVRATLISGLALLSAALSPLSNLLPLALNDRIDSGTLSRLLDIITNSMLAVTTFSLSIMVTAHLSADKGISPRAHRLLQEDGRTQTVLATFIGAFVYALAQTIILDAGLIDDTELSVIYFFTVGVIVMVVVSIMRWIAHLDGLGSVEETARRVEEQVRTAIAARNATPFLGGAPRQDDPPPTATPIRAPRSGHVQNVEAERLSQIADKLEARIWLDHRPGDWVDEGAPLAHIDADPDDSLMDKLCAAITVNDVRLPDQDADFGLIIMAEIGERALSPGINDPRTAVDVLGRLTRLVGEIRPIAPAEDPPAPRVLVPPPDHGTILYDTFDRIARDGRGFVEVQRTAQRGLATLSRHEDRRIRRAAREVSARALAYAEDGLTIRDDVVTLRNDAVASRAAETTPSSDPDSAMASAGETGSEDRGDQSAPRDRGADAD